MNEMRERLVKVLEQTQYCYPQLVTDMKCMEDCTNCDGIKLVIDEITDALLADGWIRPKFKVGQEVWFNIFTGIWKPHKTFVIFTPSPMDFRYCLDYRGCHWFIESENDIYATEAEALAALEVQND